MNNQLAIFGGKPIINYTFKKYNTIGEEEVEATQSVLKSGVLSKFIGCWDEDFYGGPKIKEFEKKWADFFKVKHAITVNSNTSGLIAAIGAIGIEPGDEVIVSPWTMSASATAILIWNAIPVFADIDPYTFNLDPISIEANITPYTKAIMVPDIFGQSADLDTIMNLAKKYNLKVIEDCAQAPGALYKNRYVGTNSDIGVFSLNYHKHIHTGEGGICVTNNDELAERLQLIRNHAEAVVADKPMSYFSNLIGFNFRMTEIEAAIGIEQLKKLPMLIQKKQVCAQQLTEGLKSFKGLKTPLIFPENTHVYYTYPLLLDIKELGISRETILAALTAEGVPALSSGYTNIHLLPIYQKKIAYGTQGFPWIKPIYQGNVNYKKGICPIAEKLHDETFFNIEICVYDYSKEDIDFIIQAFTKVWENLDQLKNNYLISSDELIN